MNIKLASERSGVSSRNIRYYEQAGLIRPGRDPENDYRIYTEEDVRTLKLIRTLRTLDMPLEDIHDVLDGRLPLPDAAARQEERLRARARELDGAIRFCGELQQSGDTAATLDVDACLTRMDSSAGRGWFTGWVNDYRAIARARQRRDFTFTPEGPVTPPSSPTRCSPLPKNKTWTLWSRRRACSPGSPSAASSTGLSAAITPYGASPPRASTAPSATRILWRMTRPLPAAVCCGCSTTACLRCACWPSACCS